MIVLRLITRLRGIQKQLAVHWLHSYPPRHISFIQLYHEGSGKRSSSINTLCFLGMYVPPL